MQVLVFDVLYLSPMMANLATNEVMTLTEMTVIERVQLSKFDLLHLDPKALILLFDLNVSLGFHCRRFCIVKSSL